MQFPGAPLVQANGSPSQFQVLYNYEDNDNFSFWDNGELLKDSSAYNGGQPSVWTPTQAQIFSETQDNSDQTFGDITTPEAYTNSQIWTNSNNFDNWMPINDPLTGTSNPAYPSGSPAYVFNQGISQSKFSNTPISSWPTNTQFGWSEVSHTEFDAWDIGCPQTVSSGTTISSSQVFDAAGSNSTQILNTGEGYYLAAQTNGTYQVWESDDTHDAGNCGCAKILWMTSGWAQSDYMAFQNGQLVVFGAQPLSALWSSGVSCGSGSCSPVATIGPDGNLTVYNGSTLLWASYSNYASAGNGLVYGDQLTYGQSISSPNGQYTLTMWSNGDLVLWNNSTSSSPWSSVTTGGANSSACISSTGYLQVWTGTGCTGTLEVQYGGTGSIDHLIVTNAGTIQLLQATDALVWQS